MNESIVLYHRVMKRENFEKAAKDLFNLLKSAQIKCPDQPRILYVDIDGHRNKHDGYDHDMFELQKDFGINFLGKYFTEVHFPLIEFKNTTSQCNNIPGKLEILQSKNHKDRSLDDLYIENYSNTEFMSQSDVYDYLKRVHTFLICFREFDFNYMINKELNTDAEVWITRWKNHISDLINELFTVFLYGNLISAAAITRTLIECFAYFSILSKEGNEFLIHEWYICSLCHSLGKNSEHAKKLVDQYCSTNNLDFNKKWNTYKDGQSPNKWLRQIIPTGKLNFETICNYLGDNHIYKDFQNVCAFVHGQDITSKLLPFTFYSSIYYRFQMMMFYIFRTIQLFPLNQYLEEQIDILTDDLFGLIEKYYTKK